MGEDIPVISGRGRAPGWCAWVGPAQRLDGSGQASMAHVTAPMKPCNRP